MGLSIWSPGDFVEGIANPGIGNYEAQGQPPYQPPPGQPGGPPPQPGYGPAPGAPGPGPMPPPAAPPPKKLTTGLIIAMIGGILMIVGVFLPWATASYTPTYGDKVEETVSGLNLFGFLILFMGILVIVLSLLKKPVGTIVCSVIGLLLSLLPLAVIGWLVSAIETTAESVGSTDFGASMGIGIILCFVGSIIGLVGGIVGKIQQ